MKKRNYARFVGCEFGYYHVDEIIRLIYGGKDRRVDGIRCARCGRKLSSGHVFTHSEEGSLFAFGNECVEYVFGAMGGDE